MKIVLFALTGFGNQVLGALLACPDVQVKCVFTFAYQNPFPYYKEEPLKVLCERVQVQCYEGFKVSSQRGLEILKEADPDLIVVSTFKEMISRDVLELPRWGIVNFHPSLLPQYRGACPTNAVLLKGEKETGVTAHYLDERIDSGNILMQTKMAIRDEDNDGSLRQQLARLSAEMIPHVVGLFRQGHPPSGIKQDESRATCVSKPVPEDGYLERSQSIPEMINRIRAFNPVPGTSYGRANERFKVRKYQLLSEAKQDGEYKAPYFIDVFKQGRGLRLFIEQGQESSLCAE